MARNNEPGMRRENVRASGSGKWSKYRAGGGTGTRFEWAGVDSSKLLDAVIAVTADGAALLLGTTRDGACGVATVCSGDDRCKLYFRTAEECERELDELCKAAREE